MNSDYILHVTPDGDDGRFPRPIRPRAHRTLNGRHHRVIPAAFNVACRECGVQVEVLHVHDLVVYCAACCPLCGGRPEGA